MATVAEPALSAHPSGTPSGERIALDLLDLAVELVGAVHDHGPDTRDEILGRIPEDRLPSLAVVLAAMVDPDRTVSELLAWTTAGPPQSLEGTDFDIDPGAPWSMRKTTCPDCGRVTRNGHMARHRRTHQRNAQQAA